MKKNGKQENHSHKGLYMLGSAFARIYDKELANKLVYKEAVSPYEIQKKMREKD